jgi:hypothetical protein
MTGLVRWLRRLLRRPPVSADPSPWRQLAERIFP